MDKCGTAHTTYWQALAANSPPEIVDASLRDRVASLRGSAGWTDEDIRKRQAAITEGRAQTSEPATQAGADLALCVLAEELKGR